MASLPPNKRSPVTGREKDFLDELCSVAKQSKTMPSSKKTIMFFLPISHLSRSFYVIYFCVATVIYTGDKLFSTYFI